MLASCTSNETSIAPVVEEVDSEIICLIIKQLRLLSLTEFAG